MPCCVTAATHTQVRFGSRENHIMRRITKSAVLSCLLKLFAHASQMTPLRHQQPPFPGAIQLILDQLILCYLDVVLAVAAACSRQGRRPRDLGWRRIGAPRGRALACQISPLAPPSELRRQMLRSLWLLLRRLWLLLRRQRQGVILPGNLCIAAWYLHLQSSTLQPFAASCSFNVSPFSLSLAAASFAAAFADGGGPGVSVESLQRDPMRSLLEPDGTRCNSAPLQQRSVPFRCNCVPPGDCHKT